MFSIFLLFIFILLIDSDANFNISTKGSRINWGRFPHRENMGKAILDWKNKKGDALNLKGNPWTLKNFFALKVGILWKYILPYTHPDPKRQKHIVNGMRGKMKILATKDIYSSTRKEKHSKTPTGKDSFHHFTISPLM